MITLLFLVTLQHEFEHKFFVKAFELIERNDKRYKGLTRRYQQLGRRDGNKVPFESLTGFAKEPATYTSVIRKIGRFIDRNRDFNDNDIDILFDLQDLANKVVAERMKARRHHGQNADDKHLAAIRLWQEIVEKLSVKLRGKSRRGRAIEMPAIAHFGETEDWPRLMRVVGWLKLFAFVLVLAVVIYFFVTFFLKDKKSD